jgi:ankyrin repeat protein
MTNCQGNTALHFAVEYKYPDLSEYMISKGANTEIHNIKGYKCLEGVRPRRDPF